MAVTTTQTNKPFNPRGNDQSPLAFNRAKLYSGKALDFDGVNDSVSVADSDDLDGYTNFTISATIKADSLPNYCRIITKGTGVYMVGVQYPGNGELEFYANGTRFFSEFVLNTGEYVHFAISFTGGQDVKFFQNGQLTSTQTHSISGTGTNSNNVVIGRNVALAGNPWDGQISNTKIFNTALTAAQVADLYNNPEKVVPTGVANTALKLWLPMQEGAGTTAYDGSGNGNHGTISGETYTHGIGAPVAQTSVISWNKGTNRFLQSNSFDTTWTKNNSTLTSGQSGYDGSTNAWKLQSNNSSSSYLQQTLSASGVLTASVYAKAGTANFIALYKSSSVNAFFNLSNGSVGTTNGTTSTSIEDVGNGWYRCSMIYNASTSYIQIYLADANGSYSSAVGSNIYIQNAQLESAATAGPFVLTLTTAQSSEVLIPQGITSGRDLFYNLFENVRKQGALNLDGNSWAEVHDNASLDVTTGLTLEAWVYWDGTASDDGIIGRWGGGNTYLLQAYDADDIRFYIHYGAASFVETGTALAANNWYHVVGTYDNTNQKIYINGSESASISRTGNISVSAFDIQIGRYGGAVSTQYDNSIAQPRIYNRALTAAEVLQNYNSGKNTYK